jgi:hypothetical protein
MIHEGYTFRAEPSALLRTQPLGRDHPSRKPRQWIVVWAFELEAQNSVPRSQSSIPMRFCAKLSCGEFALLARPRATCGATDGLYLLETRLLGLHGCL